MGRRWGAQARPRACAGGPAPRSRTGSARGSPPPSSPASLDPEPRPPRGLSARDLSTPGIRKRVRTQLGVQPPKALVAAILRRKRSLHMELEGLIAEARERRPQPMPQRERTVACAFAIAFLAAVTGLNAV